jgi:hypothetical protein
MMGLYVPQKVEGFIKAFALGLFLLLGATATGWAAPVTFRVYHINDFHGFANPRCSP